MNTIDYKEKTKAKDMKRLFELTRDKEQLNERRRQFKALQKQLTQSADIQISTMDRNSRSVPHKTGIIEVSCFAAKCYL